MNLTENNCTKCFKHFKKKELTVVLDPKAQTEDRYCDKCLNKFQKETEDDKVAVEIQNDQVLLYCYKCGLKTENEQLFKNHDCVKTKTTIDFTLSLINNNEKA